MSPAVVSDPRLCPRPYGTKATVPCGSSSTRAGSGRPDDHHGPKGCEEIPCAIRNEVKCDIVTPKGRDENMSRTSNAELVLR